MPWTYNGYYAAQPTVTPRSYGQGSANSITITPPNGLVSRTSSNESIELHSRDPQHPPDLGGQHSHIGGYMQPAPGTGGDVASLTGDTGNFRQQYHEPYMHLRIPDNKRKFTQE